MKHHQTYLFDFDGTLADTAPAIVKSMNTSLTLNGYERKNELEIRSLIGKPLQEMFQILEPKCNIEKLEQDYKKTYSDISKKLVTLFPETENFLKKLKESGAKIAIVSTKSELAINQHLKDFGIINLFDIVCGKESVTTAKPDPEGILKVMKQLNSIKENTIMIGDTADDLLAAQHAKIESALVYWTNQNLNNLQHQFQTTLIQNWSNFFILEVKDGRLEK